ncbi:hypothetical protein HanOQP8_Chr01g0005831 [Helianthus annuus]|nr:hypothetical protein HanOQP8_Chr01g0005831 [Helianthus annuus]
MSEILKTLDAADGLLLLSGSLVGPTTCDGGFQGASLADSSRNPILSRLANDNNGGVTRLSVHLVSQAFPADWKGRCSIVYQRCRRGTPSTLPAVVPIGEEVVVAEDDGGDANPWIVDPHPLSEYGEVLRTPFGVLDMFPGVERMRMVLFSCVNVGLECARSCAYLDRS